MLGLPILDVAIGIAFFYLTFAMICTTVNESLARWFNKRPKMLEEAIKQLLGNDKTKELLGHPLIAGLSRNTGAKDGTLDTPSYIPAATFATTLLDQLTGSQNIRDGNALKQGIDALTSDGAKKSLTALYQKVNGDFDRFHEQVENLYNNSMDRATGWYKRYVQKQTKVLAFVIVLWADFDTLHVAERLWTDSALRSAVVEDAKARANARTSGETPLAIYTSDQPDQGTAVEPGASPITEKEQSLINSVTGWERDVNELRARNQQAEKEHDQAEKDMERAKTERDDATKDRDKAKLDRDQAIKDRDKAKLEQDQAKPHEQANKAKELENKEQVLASKEHDLAAKEQDLKDKGQYLASKEQDAASKGKVVPHIWTKWLLMHLLGWLLSIFAISLGAPFWFDVLNRFMNLRNTGRSPNEPRAKNAGTQTQEVSA